MPEGKAVQPCGEFQGRDETFSGSVVAHPVKIAKAETTTAHPRKR